ncbi:MAG: hypothetical protein DMF71_15225 [Acidobacteria bacterium]|nr:MAG: hypothetical protein DMF71_15225 [Acidobacteriota bacterium]
MKVTGELVLSFLLNASWQVMLIGAAALLGDLMLRRTAVKYRHLLWVAALALSLLLPLATSRDFQITQPLKPSPSEVAFASLPFAEVSQPSASTVSNGPGSALHISGRAAVGLLAFYLLFLCYRGFRLVRAWARTRAASADATPIEPAGRIQTVVASCQKAIGVARVSVLSSASLCTPATVGVFRPLIILPEALARDASDEALTAAIGHEFVHVWRRDYLWNLIYEIIFLPLSFHPAAALMRRRITQTRELRCDELVTELLLRPEVYARSLVQLARSAMPFARRTRTVAVGIADADILEVRIMSLLKGTKSNTGRKRLWLLAAALLLAIPCAAAASFAFHLNIETAGAQEPSSEAQEKKNLHMRREKEMKEKAEREDQELRERIAKETNQEIKTKLEAELARRQEARARGIAFTSEGQTYLLEVDEGRARAEREVEAKRQAELARLASISMDRAIQIATSQTPGKVLECSLVGEHWEGQGESSKPGLVLYHVVILSGDEAKPAATHVLVNAVDGTIFRTSKEESRGEVFTRRHTEERASNGGSLNNQAISLPPPEYPAIARAAHASGEVTVEITVGENGEVIAAHAVSGHPLLQAAAVAAARQAKFSPTQLNGEAVKVKGALVYNFVAQ